MPPLAIPVAYWAVGGLLAAAGVTFAWQRSGGPEATARAIDNLVNNMSAADDQAQVQAQSNTQARAEPTTCRTCPQPCAHLACGVPGSRYRGGAHGCTKIPVGDQKDSHHMPADSKSPLPSDSGPAIQMDPLDHAETASYKGRVNGASYLPQRSLLARGQTVAAMMMDVADAKRVAAMSGDPTKYDAAIGQMLLYARCLQANGFIR